MKHESSYFTFGSNFLFHHLSSLQYVMKNRKFTVCFSFLQYRYYGEKVVSACIKGGASHVDISGEPQYLEAMQLKYNEEAAEKRLYIVGACGFDSVPADLGTLFLQEKFPGKLPKLLLLLLFL